MRALTLSGFIALSLFPRMCEAQSISAIARGGRQAPGMPPNTFFEDFWNLSLGDAGQVTFIANLNQNSTVEGVWTYQNGVTQKVAVMGDAAPSEGLAGSSPIWSRIDDAAMNGQGQLAILGGYSNSSGQKTGIWTGSAGALSLLAVDDAPAPGVPGATLAIARQTLSIDEAGRIPFFANLRTLSGSGIWVGTPGNLSLVVKQGDPAPGMGLGVIFGHLAPAAGLLGFPPPAFEGGRLGIASTVTGPGITTSNDYGLWTAAAGVVDKVAAEGDSAPPGGSFSAVPIGFPAPGTLGHFGYSMNASGRVAFLGTLNNGLEGIWLKDDSGVHNVVLQGQSATGNFTFSDFGPPKMNSSGQIVFETHIWNGSSAYSTLWLWNDGQLRQIASGANEPLLEEIGTQARDEYAINDAGQIAFISLGLGQYSLWGVDGGRLSRIAMTGGHFKLASGEDVSANYISFAANISDGSRISFNDSGQIAFVMDLSDGTRGIFLSSVPEPAAILIVSCASMLLWPRRRS